MCDQIFDKIDFSVSGGKRDWTEVDSTEAFEYDLEDLVEGTSYGIRVAAENSAGVGPFVELAKNVVPKSQHGNEK